MKELNIDERVDDIETRLQDIERVLSSEGIGQGTEKIVVTKILCSDNKDTAPVEIELKPLSEYVDIVVDGRNLRISFENIACYRGLNSWFKGTIRSYPIDGGDNFNWKLIDMHADSVCSLTYPTKGRYHEDALNSDRITFLFDHGNMYRSWSAWVQFNSPRGSYRAFELKCYCG